AVRLPGAELCPGGLPSLVRARVSGDRGLCPVAIPDAEEVLAVAEEVPAAGVRVLEGVVLAQRKPDELVATTMTAIAAPATPTHPRTIPATARPRPVWRPPERSISLFPT